MSEKNIDNLGWFDRHRFVTLALAMVLIWLSLLTFWYLKADEITKDPCTICAESKGEDVICTVGGFIPVKRVFYPNGSIYDDEPEVVFGGDYSPGLFNFTK